MVSNYILHGWPSMKVEVQKEVLLYWSFRDEVVVIDTITIKRKNNNAYVTTEKST